MTEHSLLFSSGLIIGRLFVGGMLALAGALKLKAGPRWFLRQILAYELVRGKTAWTLARGLPWVEILCGVFLVVGWQTPLLSLFGFVLLWGFSAAVASTFLRGKTIGCGCFGWRHDARTSQARWTIVYRNLALMGILLVLFTYGAGPLSVDAWWHTWLGHTDLTASAARWLLTGWSGSLALAIILQGVLRLRSTRSGHRPDHALSAD